MEKIIKFCYLVKVDAKANNNKYYQMAQASGEPYFQVEYGRIGASPIKQKYPISVWSKKYDEKLQKGYSDQTEYFTFTQKEVNYFKPISEPEIAKIVKRLQNWATEKIKREYTIQISKVTPQMVKKAQEYINTLAVCNTLYEFNNILNELFITLPRKMNGKVDERLAKSVDDFPLILEREQELLDVMKGQITTLNLSKETQNSNLTILESLGLKVSLVTPNEEKNIKKHLSKESVDHYVRAWKVINKRTEAAYISYCKDNNITNEKFLYHGSRNENFWNILMNGLLLNPNATITGKMFGHGIYFANRAKKSINYTSLQGSYWANGNSNTGLLAIYKVAVGESMDIFTWESKHAKLTEKDLKKAKKNSVFAHKGTSLVNDEIIVYNEAATTIRYLIELK